LTVREQRFNARVSALDELQSAVGLAQQTSLSLKRTVERLLEQGVPAGACAATAAQASSASAAPEVDLDSFKYVGFEDAFRGSQTEIRRRLEEYVPRFQGQAEVLDIGCGRGEFLDLLRDHGVQARGVDLNREMVEVSKERGLDVVESDALGYLRGLPDGSLGGIFGAQVIEHLEPAYLTRLIEAAFHALRPGGILVLETINASCWLAFFESYIRDLTHVRPIHPETLQYLLRASGFQHVEIEYKAPVPESARLAPVPVPTTSSDAASYRELVETVNENVTKLNALMFTYQDYAVIGKK